MDATKREGEASDFMRQRKPLLIARERRSKLLLHCAEFTAGFTLTDHESRAARLAMLEAGRTSRFVSDTCSLAYPIGIIPILTRVVSR